MTRYELIESVSPQAAQSFLKLSHFKYIIIYTQNFYCDGKVRRSSRGKKITQAKGPAGFEPKISGSLGEWSTAELRPRPFFDKMGSLTNIG